MRLSQALFRIALLLLPAALVGTLWLYLYPIFHSCAFPAPPSSHAQAVAPFRLLSLGDPQLEGDSSLPDSNALVFPSLAYLVPHLRDATSLEARQEMLSQAARGMVQDAVRWLKGKRKAIDLWGNDRYLAHIVRSLRWWTAPTHISVLGDLLGSQWVTDGEFRKRAGRYWDVVMKGLENVPPYVFGDDESGMVQDLPVEPAGPPQGDLDHLGGEDEREADGQGEIERDSPEQEVHDDVQGSKPERRAKWGGTTEILGADHDWDKRVINIAGNHDVGYAGDIDESRIDRFEQAFVKVNWDIWFTLPPGPKEMDVANSTNSTSHVAQTPPALRLVVLNSMNLDTPAWSPDLQSETYSFVNHIITTSRPVTDKTHATVLLTHIPLEKEPGVCVDSPYFDFFEGGHGVKEQNMLSDHSSKTVLEGIFGMSANKDAAGGGLGRKGIVLNGHDHAGCDVVHFIRQPGVIDQCRVEDIKSEEAYWPKVTPSNASVPILTLADNAVDADQISLNETTSETTLGDGGVELSEPVADLAAEASEQNVQPRWQARRFPNMPYDINPQSECTTIAEAPHVREITLRSMMGEYSGYAGFLSAWFDDTIGDQGEWVFEFSSCGLGIQHWWWGVHILDMIVIACVVISYTAAAYENIALYWASPNKKPEAESPSGPPKAGRGYIVDTKHVAETGPSLGKIGSNTPE